MLPADIIARFRVDKGKTSSWPTFDPGDTCGLDIDKKDAKELLEAGVKRLSKLQERLYAEGRWALLAVLQGIDTSGKDGVIKHVLSGVNPQGCEVHSFKQPSSLELAHDFLWRSTIALPARGRICIFNRSYYEETVVVRVHPELLEKQNLPPKLVTDDIWTAALRGHQQFRIASRPQRHRAHQVLSQYLQGRATRAPAGSRRRSRQEMEVHSLRRRGAQAVGEIPRGL